MAIMQLEKIRHHREQNVEQALRIPIEQVQALQTFRDALKFEFWLRNEGWAELGSATSLQKLEGVQFREKEGQHHVISLIMIDNNLIGRLSDAAAKFPSLPELEKVVLCTNKLVGTNIFAHTCIGTHNAI